MCERAKIVIFFLLHNLTQLYVAQNTVEQIRYKHTIIIEKLTKL